MAGVSDGCVECDMARNRRDDRYQDYDNYQDYARSRRGSSSREYDDGYGDDRYADDGYDDGYADDRYADNGYDDRYRDDRYDDRYGDDRYADDRYDDAYADDRYADDGYDSRYDDRYADDRYDDPYDENADGYGSRGVSGRGARGGSGRTGGNASAKRGGRHSASRSTGRNKASAYRQPSRSSAERSTAGSRGKKKKTRVVLFAVEAVVLVLVLGVLWFTSKATKSGKVTLDDKQLTADMNDNVVQATESGSMSGYTNLALFGVDSRDKNLAKGDNRSDTIMIASINNSTGDIKLVSVYRDTYLNTGTESKPDYTKVNAAYAKGGPEQAISVLNQNLDMNITDFVTIGFQGLTDVIDDVGGVDIDVDDSELPHLNSYQLTMSQELGYPYEEVTSTGKDHLNGLQATAYCRIRYTAGDDFKRTERQREVLMAAMEKAKTMDPSALSQAATDVFSEIYTSLDLTDDIIPLLTNISKYNIVDQGGFPTEDLRTTGNVQIGGVGQSCVIPRDLDKNVSWLHQFLFGDENYQVSPQVQTISDKVAGDTAGIG